MEIKTIDAGKLAKMFLAGAKAIEAQKAVINELNVFPVPDGDTGTNMTLTIMSAAKEVAALQDIQMDTLSKAMSSGSLRGARGNSGVILSQLIRGFTKVVKTETELDKAVIASAFQKATESAYKAVMKPKEGTILTVAKGAADKASELAKTDIGLEEFAQEIIKHAEYVLSQTPEMLPVLKQAGVVDSGGQGLVEIFKGAYDCLTGKEMDLSIADSSESKKEPEKIKYSYFVSFTDKITDVFNAKNENDFRTYLDSLGESLKFEVKGDKVRISIYTNDPGLAIQKGLTYGQLSGITVENTQEAKKAEQTPQGKEKKDRPADTLPEEKAVVHIEKASPATKEEPEERKTTEAAEAPKVKEAVKEEAAPEKKEAVPEKKEAVPEKGEAVPEKKEAAKEEADGGTKDSIKAEAAEGSSEAKKEDEVDITSDTGSDTETDREKADDKDEEDEDYYFDEKPVFSEPPKEMGFVAVSSGEGLQAIFRGLGVDYVITGGQTMNPSTEDMLYAIDRVNAKNIFILPNNKNIIMAANQAQYMAEDKKIIVIPTKTVPQGITALINYSMDASAEDNEKLMNEEIKKVKTGQVTYAVRDTMISDMEIKQGNIMGIGDDDILAVGTIVEDTAMEMLEKMVDEDSELICIYYGNEVDEEAADDFLHEVEEKFPDCDVELHAGGQPIYYYIVSVE